MKKFLKIKTGEIYIDGKTYDVFQSAWEKKSKNGNVYYETKTPIFVQEYQEKKVEVEQVGV